MANRFYTMTGYHSLIEAHAIIAAITFLFVIPAAVFLMRFYSRSSRSALRFHIWLQILALLLATVVIAIGFFAVGPERALSNPHHGIGLAIYVLLWVQMIGGCIVRKREKHGRHFHVPLTAMLHHWLGRAIALLGITQLALGLTLYGSARYLFVLYTLFVFGLVVLYFLLEWLHERRRAELGTRGGSYYSDEVVEQRPNRNHAGVGKLAAAGAAGAGLAALWGRRSKSKTRPEVAGSETETSGTYSYYTDEKSQPSRHGWGRRLLEVGAVGGGVAAVKRLFDRRRNDSVSDVAPYRPPLGGNQSVTTDSMSRVEEGRLASAPLPPGPIGAPVQGSPGYSRPTHPLSNPPITPNRRNSASSYDYSTGSSVSGSPSKYKRPHTFRDAVAAGGVVFAARQLFKNRRQRKEEQRQEEIRQERVEAERIQRMNSAHRYTGDGVPPPRRYPNNGYGSQSASDFTGSLIEGGPGPGGLGLPVAGAGAAAATALADRNRIRPVGQDPVIAPPGPHSAMPIDPPPIPPLHQQDVNSSGSEMYTTNSGRNRHRHHLRDEAAGGLAGAALGAMATDATRRRRDDRRTDSGESQPVSLKMKVHNDGRHVTLRRLTEEEAAAQRVGRNGGPSGRRRRNSSFSSSDGGDALRVTSAERRRRRNEAIEAQQAANDNGPSNVYPRPPPPGTHYNAPFAPPAVDPQTGHTYTAPPVPPIPQGSTMSGHLTSPGSVASPGTETSGATEYANNRRRRRAERAQARLAREGRGGSGNTVEFS